MKTLSKNITVTSASPNTEGMNAITAWMLTCIFFVFGALGGYAFLLWRKKKSCLKRHRKVKITDEEAKTRLKKKEEHRSRVDDFFLVFFPGLCQSLVTINKSVPQTVCLVRLFCPWTRSLSSLWHIQYLAYYVLSV